MDLFEIQQSQTASTAPLLEYKYRTTHINPDGIIIEPDVRGELSGWCCWLDQNARPEMY